MKEENLIHPLIFWTIIIFVLIIIITPIIASVVIPVFSNLDNLTKNFVLVFVIGIGLVFGGVLLKKLKIFELTTDSNQNADGIPSDDSRYITSDVKKAVWKRDHGRCVMCGSRRQLEYDHDIPFSKGGSNTANNIRLLCKECNRQKSARIE